MATCFRSLQGLALRVTRLDSCCKPVGGNCSTVVSESFVTVSLSPEVEDPEEFTVKLANGKICLSELSCASLKRYNVEMEICNADPDLFNIFAGTGRVADFSGNIVGFQVDEDLGDCSRFALEFWTRVPLESCTTGAQQYLYWLLPCVSNGRLGDFNVENGPLTFTLTAEATSSSVWAKGQYNVVPQNIAGTPGKLLLDLPADVPLHVQLTTVAPPLEFCGCQALVVT